MKNKNQIGMFQTEDLPLFSGTAQNTQDSTFNPKPTERQDTFFECEFCQDTGLIGTVYKRTCPFCEKGLHLACEPNTNQK